MLDLLLTPTAGTDLSCPGNRTTSRTMDTINRPAEWETTCAHRSINIFFLC